LEDDSCQAGLVCDETTVEHEIALMRKGSGVHQARVAGNKRTRRVKQAQGWRNYKMCTVGAALQVLRGPKCCKQDHLQSFTAKQIQELRGDYHQENEVKRETFLHSTVKQRGTGSKYDKATYRLCGMPVCAVGVQRIVGIGSKTFFSAVRYVLEGDTSALMKNNAWHANKFRGKIRITIIAWIGEFTSLRGTSGEWMPDKQELHLAYNQLTHLHAVYEADQILDNVEAGSYQYFCRLFKKYFPHVKVHKRKEFSICDTCHMLQETLVKDRHARALLKEARQRLEKHYSLVLEQKRKYWKHIRKARQNPALCQSTILDGMDSLKTVIPHWPRTPHLFDNAWCLQVHLEGVINHGHEPHAHAFLSPPGVKKGACLAIEVLCRLLIRTKKVQGYVAPTWYIQADNATGEFKNSVCMMFLGILVQLEIYKKVYVVFLLLLICDVVNTEYCNIYCAVTNTRLMGKLLHTEIL
jgi:hypothetical protein